MRQLKTELCDSLKEPTGRYKNSTMASDNKDCVSFLMNNGSLFYSLDDRAVTTAENHFSAKYIAV